MEETKVVDIGISPLADHGVLVEVVVSCREEKTNKDDDETPSLVQSEDEVVSLEFTLVV